MNTKLRFSLLLIAVGCDVDMHANPLVKTMTTAGVMSGAYVVGVMDLAFFYPHLVENLFSNAGAIAAVTATYSAPVYIGFDESDSKHIISEYRGIRTNLIKKSLADGQLLDIHDKLKNKQFDSYGCNVLLAHIWEAKRLSELAQDKKLDISHFPSNTDIALNSACLALPATSLLVSCCGCDTAGPVILAGAYVVAGATWCKSRAMHNTWESIKKQIHNEVYRGTGKQSAYQQDEQFLSKVDAMIQDVMTKREQEKVNALKSVPQRSQTLEQIAAKVLGDHFPNI